MRVREGYERGQRGRPWEPAASQEPIRVLKASECAELQVAEWDLEVPGEGERGI